MTPNEREAMKQLFLEVLREEHERCAVGCIDMEQHREDHRWIGTTRMREDQNARTRVKVMQHVLGWGTIVAIAGLGRVVYLQVIQILTKAGGGH